MTMPAKYAVRDYLKKQGKKQEKLSSEMTGVLLERFHAAYRAHRVDAEAMKAFAQEYAGYLEEAGCFSLKSEYTPPTRISPHRERSTIRGYAVEPISLGQGWRPDDDSKLYTENAALIRCHVGEFKRKKALLGQGFGGVALTQHVMERVYERTEVNWTDLPRLIEHELEALLNALTIADMCGLWLDYVSEGVGGYRSTAVPYSNGLMITNLRVVFGTVADGDFGFRIQIPSGRLETPFLNNDWVLDDGRSDDRPVMTTCGVTYFNVTTLDDREADYYYSYRALMEEMGDELLGALTYFNFAPTLTHERHPLFDLRRNYGAKIERLKALLQAGWLCPKVTNPICLLLPFDHQV